MAVANTNNNNRVHRALDEIDRAEHAEIQRHGPAVRNSRPFLVNRRQAYKELLDDFKDKSPNIDERASLRILKGQRRAMLRQLYPNPFVRLVRNGILLFINLVVGVVKLAVGLGKMISMLGVERSYIPPRQQAEPAPLQQNQQSSQKENRNTIAQEQEQQKANGLPVEKGVDNGTGIKPGAKLSDLMVAHVVPVKQSVSHNTITETSLKSGRQQDGADKQQQVNGTTAMQQGVLNRVYVQRPNKISAHESMGKGIRH